jgi:hypothetical protein
MTGVVEWAIDTACANTPELADITKVWSPFESDRFVRMADFYGDTLDPDQQLLWQFIRAKNAFWPLHPRGPHADDAPMVQFTQGFNFPLLRDVWAMLQAHVLEGAPWDAEAFKLACDRYGVDPDAALVIQRAPEETKQG